MAARAMTFPAALRNLLPEELSQAATTHDQSAFLTLYGESPFLLVRLRPGDVDLAAGLGATAVRAEAGAQVKAVIGSMNFRTEMVVAPSDLSRERGRPPDLIATLAND